MPDPPTILNKIDEKFAPTSTPTPPLFPHTQIKDGNMARVGFCAASSLIWGRGEGGGLLFHFILSKIVGWLGQLNSYFCPHAYTCVHLQKAYANAPGVQ